MSCNISLVIVHLSGKIYTLIVSHIHLVKISLPEFYFMHQIRS